MRGWGEREFRLAAPGFLSLVRFGVMAESMLPVLQCAEAILAVPLPIEPNAKLDVALQKQAVGSLVPAFRAVLYPEDEDV